MKRISLSGLFTRYLFSYTLPFIIPLLALGLIIYNTFTSILKEQIDKYSYDMLISAQTSIDYHMEELNNIAMQIVSIPNLRQIKYSGDFIHAMNAVAALRSMAATNNFINEIFLYYKGVDLLYSSSGTYRLEHFASKIYKFEHWDSRQFLYDMNKLDNITIRPAEKIVKSICPDRDTSYLTYIVPIPYNSSNPEGAVFFTIEEKTFGNALSEILETGNSRAWVLDNQNRLLAGYGSEQVDYMSLFNSQETGNNFFSKKLMIEKKEFSVLRVRSKTVGWTYIVSVPVSTVTQKMSPLIAVALLGFTAVVILGIFIIILLARINYKPINDLTQYALKGIHERFGRGYNEIETVKQAVSHMKVTISTLRKKVEYAAPSLKRSILSRLIKGYYQDFETARAQAAEARITLEEGSYCVAVCLISSHRQADYTAVIGLVESLELEKLSVFALDKLDEDYIVLLFAAEDPWPSNDDIPVNSIINSLKDMLSTDLTVGVGKWVSAVSEIGTSYLQASTALDFRFIKGKNTMTFYRELEQTVNHIDYDSGQHLDLLKLRVLKGNPEEVSSILDSIFEDIKIRQIPIFHAKSLCYNIMNSLLNSIYKLRKDLNLRECKYLDIISLMSSDTIDELHGRIREICLFICSAVADCREENGFQKVNEMLSYIQDYFTSFDFSVQAMADRFHMSISGLSGYFKAKTGRNITDYVNHLRMEKAKKLLEETDASLQEITVQVGYINVSSFIRKFKTYTKVTPGTYREIIK